MSAEPEIHDVDVADRPRRKLCIVGPGFHFLGGLSVYTCRLANVLSEDFDVSVILLQRLIPAKLYPGGHRVGQPLTSLTYSPEVNVAAQLDWYWGAQLRRAVKFLRHERPDVLVLQWWTAATLHTYLALAVAARRLGIPVILEFHEAQDTGEAEVPMVAAYCRKLMPALLSRASGALVHNQHDLMLLKQTYGSTAIERLIVEIAPHGPYDHLTAPAGPAVSILPPAERPTTELLFFGLIRPYKGLEDLIQAFNDMEPEQAEQFSLTVVGETWEGWTLPAELIAASPYRDKITFVNRYVTDEEAGEFFAAADAIVLPYRRGSASGPLHIAMSQGMHVVMYGVGGLVEAVQDYDGAVVVPPADVPALQSALLGLPDRREQRFADPHSWAATGAALEKVAAALAVTS